jgi:gamma-glutamyltranspeptidase/glutathione hydrolase
LINLRIIKVHFMKNYFCLSLLLILAGCSGTGNKSDKLISGFGISSKNGMVVSAHSESSRIGVEILMKGGNAVDAAVATDLALAVCYPEAGNIGGGGFMVIRTSEGITDAIDYREKAPVVASRDMYLGKDGSVTEGLSTDTHLASGVPGTVDGIIAAHSKYGKMPFREVIQPAIDLAEKGFRVSAGQAASLNGNRKAFIERNLRRPAFVKDSLWKEGDILIQPDLAATLRLIRDKGRDGFYSGKTAFLIISEMKRGNGIICEKDLSDYRAVWRAPLRGTYKGYDIITICPPSSGGLTLLQLLGMAEKYDLKAMGLHSAESVHLIIEAERRAFADRAEFLGDPDFVDVPVKQLLNKKYLAARMKDFDPEKASQSSAVGHGSPEGYVSEETTHYSVVDGMGNAVAVTTTLNGTFGTGIVVDGAGFLLNNQMDDFSSKPGSPNMYGLVGGEANAISAGKRMLSSMTPAIIEKDGKLLMVLGSPGGSTIPTSVFQVVVNVIDYGLNIQDAVDAGRFHHQWLPDNITYEQICLDSITLRKLEKMGHIFKPRSAIGRVNAILKAEDGTLKAGADPRGNNVAVGY